MADKLEELERFANLRERGLLTADEFEAQKARLLGEDAPPGQTPPERTPVNLAHEELSSSDLKPPGPPTGGVEFNSLATVIGSDYLDRTLASGSEGYKRKWLNMARGAGVSERDIRDKSLIHAISGKISWNWAAFFLTFFWLVFRKVRSAWRTSAIYFVVAIAISWILTSMGFSVTVRAALIDLAFAGVMVVFGLFGDSWLLATVIRDYPAPDRPAIVHKSWVGALALLGVVIALSLLQLGLMAPSDG